MYKRIHELKTAPEFFELIVAGKKKFEVRCNDRGYCVGDILCLKEWLSDEQKFTGNITYKKVTYILDDERFCISGYVILSLGELFYNSDVF